jgi:1-phosphofructokinase family hexose kinase
MIVTVTPNPAVDVTYAVASVELGESHRIHDVTERAGGKGVNVASVLAAMGRHAIALAPVGAADVATYAMDLTTRGVSHRLVESPSPTRRSVAVVEAGGRTTLFNEAGAAQPDSTWAHLAAALTALAEQAAVVTVSGSLPSEAPTGLVRRFVLEAARAGRPTVVDCGGPALEAALAAGPALVAPNRAEADAAVGEGPGRHLSVGDLAFRLVDGGAMAAAVTDGANGVQLLHDDVELRAWLPDTLTGNPTGAGDAMTASLAADLEGAPGLPAGRDDWADVLRRAVAWSAAAVLQPVAGAIDPADVERLLPRVEVEESLV